MGSRVRVPPHSPKQSLSCSHFLNRPENASSHRPSMGRLWDDLKNCPGRAKTVAQYSRPTALPRASMALSPPPIRSAHLSTAAIASGRPRFRSHLLTNLPNEFGRALIRHALASNALPVRIAAGSARTILGRPWEGPHACPCGGAGAPCPWCNVPEEGAAPRGCRKASLPIPTRRSSVSV